MEGWIKLHRCLIDKPIWVQSLPEQKVVLITVLCLANHSDKEWIWQGEKFVVREGQFITSLDSLASKSGVSKRSVRTALANFEKLEFLTDKSTKTGRLITVINWSLYQGDIKKTTDKSTKNRQSTDKAPTPNNNDKNDKNEITINLFSVLSEFKAMRDKIKKPLTDHAEKLLMAKLDKMATTEQGKIEILNQSIMNCWQGIFEVKGDRENVRSVQARTNMGANGGGKTASGVPEDFWG